MTSARLTGLFSPDGKRILLLAHVEQAEQPPIMVVLNWQSALKK